MLYDIRKHIVKQLQAPLHWYQFNFSSKDVNVCHNSFMLFWFFSCWCFCYSYAKTFYCIWLWYDSIRRCWLNDTVSVTLWSSTLQNLLVLIELHSHVLAMIVLGIFKFTVLWVDTVECNISDTLGEPCSKSTELYDKSRSLCYSVTVKNWDNLFCLSSLPYVRFTLLRPQWRDGYALWGCKTSVPLGFSECHLIGELFHFLMHIWRLPSV